MYKVGQYVCPNAGEDCGRVARVTNIFHCTDFDKDHHLYEVDFAGEQCRRVIKEEELDEATLKEGDHRLIHELGEVRVVSYGRTRAGTGIVTIECLEGGLIKTKLFWQVISSPRVDH